MPRSNRPRRRAGGEGAPDDDPIDISRALSGTKRVEVKRDGSWFVQPQTAASAVKPYVCPGCGLAILEGTAHLVAWRSDGLFGDAEDLAARRHWHSHCWKIRT